MRIKCKTIKLNGNSSFLRRLSIYFKNGSIKIHLITRSDKDEPHTHPWDFKSLLIIPYKEQVFLGKDSKLHLNFNHKSFKVVKREANDRHRTKLYKMFGIEIPALTIGWYGHKKQLCSFCSTLGYCKENPPKGLEGKDLSKEIKEFDPFNDYERVV